jgi:ABC-2 type transport system ATP-binding protein
MESDLAIDVRNATKIYKRRIHALAGVSIAVHRGEVFGLLGPNGAGKSTLIKIMMTVVRATHVEGLLLGEKVGHKPTLARVGYLPEHHRFPRYLTGRETLEFFAALSGVGRSDRKRRSRELLDTVGMTAWADKKVGEYSKGMMQRIGLAQALVNDPDLVLLDEPTDGVDPVGRRDIREVLQQLGRQGKTVFVNSHLLSELEMMCDRVAILVNGQVARQGRISELNAARQRYEIEVCGLSFDPTAAQKALGSIVTWTIAQSSDAGSEVLRRAGSTAAQPGSSEYLRTGVLIQSNGTPTGNITVEVDGDIIRLGTMDSGLIQPVLDALRSGGWIIHRVQAVKPSLEDLYMDAVVDPTTGQSVKPGAAINARRQPAPSPVVAI